MTADLLGGRYQILSPLRAGGMGEVSLAHDTGLERRVAVKLLPAQVLQLRNHVRMRVAPAAFT
jgi:serine/threonine protein kinase